MRWTGEEDKKRGGREVGRGDGIDEEGVEGGTVETEAWSEVRRDDESAK